MRCGRALLLAAAGLLEISATKSSDLIQHYAGGGVTVSPVGKWRIWSATPRTVSPSTLWLRGPGVRRRLMTFERMIDVVWPNDGRFVLVNQVELDGDRLRVFTLGPRETGRPTALETAIARKMIAKRPQLSRDVTRRYTFGAIGDAPCVAVSEEGLPPGRRDGPLALREGAFRLDLAGASATVVKDCPSRR